MYVSNQLHITVCAVPTEGTLNLSDELSLVKTALLYSDRAKLCSLKSFLILSVASIGNLNEKQQLDFFSELLPLLFPGRFSSQAGI